MELLTAVLYFILLVVLSKLADYVIRLPRLGQLQDRYIFVTGCDTGFGHELTKKLDGLGCHVFAGCFTEAGETELHKTCSDRVHTVPLDVTKSDSVKKAYETVKKELAGKDLWGVVNNAGVSNRCGPPEWLRLEDYKDMLDINLFGLIDVCVTFLPLLKRSRGRIVNMSSAIARFALPNSSPYAICKFSVEAYSDCLRRAMKPFGVSVHILEPGLHHTSITDGDLVINHYKRAFDRAPPEIQEEYGRQYIDDYAAINDYSLKHHYTEGLDDVVDAYVHALLGRFPRARYLVGKDARYLVRPISWTPEWVQDYIVGMDKLEPAVVKSKK